MRKTVNINDIASRILKKHIDPEKGLKSSDVEWEAIGTDVVEHIYNHGRDGHPIEIPGDYDSEDSVPGHLGGKTSSHILLGSYTALPSRGTLRLYGSNLSNYFWGILKTLKRASEFPSEISPKIMENLAVFTVLTTYCHEVFHYRADIASILFGARLSRLDEEALAVAFEYHHAGNILQHNSRDPKISKLYDDFKVESFSFSAPGYKDWRKYEKPQDFRNKLVEHVIHPNAMRLLSGAQGKMDGWFADSLYMFMMDFPINMLDEVEV